MPCVWPLAKAQSVTSGSHSVASAISAASARDLSSCTKNLAEAAKVAENQKEQLIPFFTLCELCAFARGQMHGTSSSNDRGYHNGRNRGMTYRIAPLPGDEVGTEIEALRRSLDA